MAERSERRLLTALLALALAGGIALRLWQVGTTPLWLDEAYSAYAAAHGFGFLWHVVPRYETHPPLYYSLLRLWTLAFGDGLMALRALGLAAGFATLAALVWPAREAARLLGWDTRRARRLEVVILALSALSIPLVEMAREVRPYPLMILAYALAVGCVLRVARAAGDRRAPAWVIALYLVVAALLAWLHTLGPLWLLALAGASAVALGAHASRRAWAAWLAGHAVVALVYLPALLIALDQAPSWIRSSWLRFSFGSAAPHLLVLYAVPGWQALAALALLGMGAVALGFRAPRLLVMLALLAVVPVASSLALSATITPVFITRTMTPVAVPTLLLIAIGACAWDGRGALIGGGLAAVLAANMAAVGVQERAAGPPQDWYRAIAWLERRWRPGDLILAYPNEGALPLRRALRDRALAWPVRPVPSEVPSLDVPEATYPTGSRGVPTLPHAMLDRIAADPALPRRVWLMRLGAHTYDPGNAFLDTLLRERRPIARLAFDPIDLVGLELSGKRRSTAAQR